ncbi:MAG: hypothetical protein PHQ98_01440 [Candidatus ainarchaeum sp.]|nr:hypothetical protein [Candidatus ainarchaeum sp.]
MRKVKRLKKIQRKISNQQRILANQQKNGLAPTPKPKPKPAKQELTPEEIKAEQDRLAKLARELELKNIARKKRARLQKNAQEINNSQETSQSIHPSQLPIRQPFTRHKVVTGYQIQNGRKPTSPKRPVVLQQPNTSTSKGLKPKTGQQVVTRQPRLVLRGPMRKSGQVIRRPEIINPRKRPGLQSRRPGR